MKKILTVLIAFLVISFTDTVNAQITSIANGNWTNPLTWGGIPPLPGSTVIINHTVTLDTSYAYTTGSITVNSTGSLIGNSPMRALALYGGALTVTGNFNIPRVALGAGTIINNGTFTSDSLYNNASFTNNANAILNADQLMNDVSGVFINSGSVLASNVLNLASFTNNLNIQTNDFLNSKSFINSASAELIVNHDFLNKDTLATPAVCQNDGMVRVGNDWKNDDEINGTGRFCIAHNTNNTGLMTGTFDFCDLSGGNLDLNTGTVDLTITYCLYSCTTGFDEVLTKHISYYPNPSSETVVFNVSDTDDDFLLELFDINGKTVFNQITNNHTENSLALVSKGLYFYKLTLSDGIFTGKLLIE
ncbi:MAG: T9SS type A sorting domain-containing protein [Bacteroidales bacterium]|nr:T9SS type A sorting domain-containing protein [Bacteroidales bacterium]